MGSAYDWTDYEDDLAKETVSHSATTLVWPNETELKDGTIEYTCPSCGHNIAGRFMLEVPCRWSRESR